MPMIALTLLVALIIEPQRAPEFPVNLVGVPPPPERPLTKPTEGCVNVTGHSPHATGIKPLKATLAATDRLAYTVGDEMSFNVVLENTGTAPLVLGLSRDPEVAPKTIRPCRIEPPGVHFAVALVLWTKNRAGAIITQGGMFFGSLDAAGTTVVLQPGDRARVQLPARVVTGPGMDPVLTADWQSVSVKAFVTIERDGLYVSEYSDNALQIELKAPPIRRASW
jgi:hypothetical protein